MFQNITFYQENKERLRKKYSGRYIIIKDEEVKGDYCTWSEASVTGLRLFETDNFFIKFCY